MSDEYTPDEAELIGCYAGAMEEQAGEDYDQAKADAERGIAKVKADALREAAGDLIREAGLIPMPTSDHPAVRALRERADRIEEEA